MEEKIKFLEEKGVEIGSKVDDSEWIVCYENITDASSLGFYPIQDEFKTLEEAIDFAYNCEINNIGVNWISQYP